MFEFQSEKSDDERVIKKIAFSLMTECVAGCTLFHFSRSEGSTPICSIPDSFSFGDELESASGCAFPEYNKDDNQYFCFTTVNYINYCWYFVHKNEMYSIVISSRIRVAYHLLTILKNQNKGTNSPQELLQNLADVLLQWKVVSPGTLITHTGNKIPLNTHQICYRKFDPTKSFGSLVDYDQLWHYLLTRKYILIVCNNSNYLMEASFSLLSLISPLVYSEPILFGTRIGDPRFADIVKGSKRWNIVSTSNPLALRNCKQFDLVIEIPSNAHFNSNTLIRTAFKHQTHKLLSRFDYALDNLLEQDPFSDILQRPLTDYDLEMIAPSNDRKSVLTFEEMKLFVLTPMFRYWRNEIIGREAFRSSILSFEPHKVIKTKTKDQLRYILAQLTILKKSFKTDCHVKAVLNRYIELIEKE